ncbi:DUF2304 domain-containing protein [Ectobacillus sp. sgz5001026]|jgi:hypothetical protein|uniref:DUF2304 domain-containing protein n=1 Tax=Ectobacillus sp. sgz5001026 TaxID=3242473 RepID=UPI0036D2670A
MTFRLQALIIIGVIFTFVQFLNLVRKEKMELRYVLIWFAVLIGILILTIFPAVIDSISFLLGVETPMNSLFFFGFIFTSCLLFYVSVTLSKLSVRIKNLTQQVALYQFENEKLKKYVTEKPKEEKVSQHV